MLLSRHFLYSVHWISPFSNGNILSGLPQKSVFKIPWQGFGSDRNKISLGQINKSNIRQPSLHFKKFTSDLAEINVFCSLQWHWISCIIISFFSHFFLQCQFSWLCLIAHKCKMSSALHITCTMHSLWISQNSFPQVDRQSTTLNMRYWFLVYWQDF